MANATLAFANTLAIEKHLGVDYLYGVALYAGHSSSQTGAGTEGGSS
jgi:hypothetical protein